MERFTKIIAEVASNHGGDIKLAKEFIRIAADTGVDYLSPKQKMSYPEKSGCHPLI